MPSILPPSEGRLFDGASARVRAVTAARTADGLAITGDGYADAVPASRLRRAAGQGRLTLHRVDSADWRLILPGAVASDYADLPALHGMGARQWGWVVGGMAALVAGVLAIWFGGNLAAAWLAPLVPRSVSEQMGRTYAETLAGDGRACAAPAGRAALDRLVARVAPADLVEPVHVRVARVDESNAFTLPGGEIVILAGLIGEAKGPDEVAGVLAHELGHVQKRHPNQALIRHFGIDVFLTGLGGNLGSALSTGLFFTNSRAAEREADDQAIAILRAAKVSPLGAAAFFDRLGHRPDRKEDGSPLGRLASLATTHPSDASRQSRFRSAATYPAIPALSPAEWKALRGICG